MFVHQRIRKQENDDLWVMEHYRKIIITSNVIYGSPKVHKKLLF